jgi:hypothetical protein
MLFRLDRFFFDERDIFTALFGVFLAVSYFIHFSLLPFRSESLMVVFLFLLVTRTIVSSSKFNSYFFIVLSALLFSIWLSPYGLAIYLFIVILLYTKTNLI